MPNNIEAILNGLNSEQKKAVQCVEGPVLIVAGAGSGKTRVLTSRIAYILENGCAANRILALTFTKKAAGEMKERVAVMVGENRARRLCMGTFHSVFVRFLREYAPSIGYPENFTIYDQSDSLSAIKACIKELQLDDKVYKPKEVLSRISMAKNNLSTAEAYRNNQNAIINDTHAKKPRICDIFSLYSQKCRQSGVMDFDDLLLNTNILFRDNPEALENISSRFSYILVDEYQDTNYAQYLILKKLSAGHRNICVVGDDSQSIYAFRGAKIENILGFKKDYPECRTFRLEQNYRSTRNIVDAANSLIEKNEGRIPKTCFSEGKEGDKIDIIQSYTEQEEAVQIVSGIISRMQEDKAQYKDFAILYRTNSQSRALEEALRRRNIPYMIYSGNSFFERTEVKDLMAYFKLVVNPSDDESFKRVVNKPARGIGNTTLQAVEEAARQNNTNLFAASGSVPKIAPFREMILKLSEAYRNTDAFQIARQIADVSGLYAYYKLDTSIEGLSRVANLDELLNSVAVFVEERKNEILEESEFSGEGPVTEPVVTLDEFIENVSLLSNVDIAEDEDTNNRVALMTVHSAKGLEFPYVFIAGLEENLFPGSGVLMSIVQLEEERRLFYVALTRAMRNVTLSFAHSRMRNGKSESNSPSRFIREIDSRYISNPLAAEDLETRRSESFSFKPFRGFSRPEAHPAPRSTVSVASRPAPTPAAKPDIIDPNFVPTPMHELRAGQRVEHNRFGGGMILDITGTIPELKARIAFDNYGEKTIMLKYSKLRIEKK